MDRRDREGGQEGKEGGEGPHNHHQGEDLPSQENPTFVKSFSRRGSQTHHPLITP